jgi:hypothetical protein
MNRKEGFAKVLRRFQILQHTRQKHARVFYSMGSVIAYITASPGLGTRAAACQKQYISDFYMDGAFLPMPLPKNPLFCHIVVWYPKNRTIMVTRYFR